MSFSIKRMEGLHEFKGWRGRPPLFLREFEPHPAELAALLLGIKPIIAIFGQSDSLHKGYIESICRYFGLCHLSAETPGEKGRKILWISRNKETIASARRALDRDSLFAGGGRNHLGYPKCCAHFYTSNKEAVYASGTKNRGLCEDEIQWIFSNTQGSGSLPFVLNDVFNFFSRSRPYNIEGDRRSLEHINRINRPLLASALHVIPWHPCSYRCSESIRAGRDMYKFLQKHLLSFADKIRWALSRPVLYLDKYRFVVFSRGSRIRNDFIYEGVEPPFSLLDKQFLHLFVSGNRLKIDAAGVEVFRNRRRLGRIEEKGFKLLLFG